MNSRTTVERTSDRELVATRTVDTVYTDRRGALIVEWPERDLVLTITPSDGLRHTVVYCPADADFFCVEPVTHSTDALNDDKRAYEMARLEPGDWHEVIVDFQATLLDSPLTGTTEDQRRRPSPCNLRYRCRGYDNSQVPPSSEQSL